MFTIYKTNVAEYKCVSEHVSVFIFFINEFEIIYLNSVYFVGVEPKPEVERLILLND